MPYAPGVQFDAGIIERSGANLTDAITRFGEKRKQEATEAATLRKLAGVYDPENKDKYTAMGLDDLRATAKAHALKTALEDRAAKQQSQNVEDQARYMGIQHQAAAVNALNRQQTEQDAAINAVPGFADALSAPPDNSVEAPLSNEQRIARALKDNPAVARLPGNTMASQLLERALSGHGENGVDAMPVPFSTGGMEGIVSKRTGAIHVKGGGNAQTFEQRLQLLDRKALFDEKRSLHNAMSRSLLPDEKAHYQSQLDAIDAQLKAGGTNSASQPNITEADYGKLKKGQTYWWNGKQIAKE